jgi:hypothetical protein
LESLFGKKRPGHVSRRETQNNESQALFELPAAGRLESSACIMKDDAAD